MSLIIYHIQTRVISIENCISLFVFVVVYNEVLQTALGMPHLSNLATIFIGEGLKTILERTLCVQYNAWIILLVIISGISADQNAAIQWLGILCSMKWRQKIMSSF